MCLGIPGQVVEVLTEHGESWRWSTFRAPDADHLGLLEPDESPPAPVTGCDPHGLALERIDEARRVKPWPFGADGSAELTIASGNRGTPARRGANEGRGVPGPVLFARYAFPPTSTVLRPGDHDAFFSYGVAGADDRGLRALSQQFAGPGPTLSDRVRDRRS